MNNNFQIFKTEGKNIRIILNPLKKKNLMIENDFIEVHPLESINGTLSVFSIVVLVLINQTSDILRWLLVVYNRKRRIRTLFCHFLFGIN
jgi:hypothetical protein